ncbi:MAG: hypothetical protein Q9223_002267 [Gallowayella weberi]
MLVLREHSPPHRSTEAGPYKPAPVLRPPTEQFPEDPNFVRPGVASAEDSRRKEGIPQYARYTRISRRLVDPEVLQNGRERFEEEEDHVIVLRVLTRQEVEHYAAQTHEFRSQKLKSWSNDEDRADEESEASSEQSDESQRSFVRYRESSPFGEGVYDPDHEDFEHGNFQQEDSTTGRNVHKRRDSLTQDKDTDQPSPQATRKTHNHLNWENSRTGSGRDYTPPYPTSGPDTGLLKSVQLSSSPDSYSPSSRQLDHPTYDSIPHNWRHLSVGVSTQRSNSHHQASRDEGILTYAEEIMVLQLDHILIKLEGCTEKCRDIATTLRFVQSIQPDLGPYVKDTYDLIKNTNTWVKKVLIHPGPLRESAKTLEIVIAELDTLLFVLRASLDILQSNFDMFDITAMSSSERQEAWEHCMRLFETKNVTSMVKYLALVCRFSQEIASNFRAGIFTSPEAELLKKRLTESNKDHRATSKPTSRSDYAPDSTHGSRSRARYFHSPSRFTDSPLGSPMNRGFYDPANRGTASTEEWIIDVAASDDSLTNMSFSSETSSGEKRSSATTLTSSTVSRTGDVKWFWICQADVLPGHFATPWQSLFNITECIGAISVLLSSLEQYTDKSNLHYVQSQTDNTAWLRLGRTTYPSYAHNSAGGVVVASSYRATTFVGFKKLITPLELLKSYEYQVDRSPSSTTQNVIDSTAELMGLDSWLSISGRQSEIIDGPSSLLRTLPTLIQLIMTDFHLEFSSVDRTSKEGGFRITKTISDSLLQYLTEQNLSDAEQLFCIVALLRTAKMALCVARGTDTAKLRDVLVQDVQVYLA